MPDPNDKKEAEFIKHMNLRWCDRQRALVLYC
jgi:hypothetical protein